MALLVAGSADQKLITKWEDNLKSWQQQRIKFEHQWHQNMSFFFGRQWIITSKTSNGAFQIAEQPARYKWRVRHTANRILRIIRTELTKLSKEEPQFYCLPSSMDESDRIAALAGDAISEYILRTKYFNRKRTLATFWAVLCGSSYLKNYYDPNKLDIDGQPGRIDFQAVTPFHLFVPNLQATEMEDQPAVIEARTLPPEEVYNLYHIDVPPGTDSSTTVVDSRFLTSMGITNTKTEQKQCYIKEVYVKSCKDFPNGAMFVFAEGKMLYVWEAPEAIEENIQPTLFDEETTLPVGPSITTEDLRFGKQNSDGENQKGLQEVPVDVSGVTGYDHTYPFPHGRFPYAKIDHIPTGMWYGESVIKSLISPQKEYNRTRSIMLEHRNLAGKPQWSYVAGAIDPKHFTSEPGLLLRVTMGFDAPKALEQPPMSPVVMQELEVSIRDMDDISSQFEISKGRTPPGVEAASAIAYLSEENDTTLYHTVQSLENAVQETGVQVLANVHAFWDEDRIIRMTSRNQYMDVRQFKAQDLNPIMDFRVEPNSMMPRSIAAKQAFITELMKMGPEVMPPRLALKYLQMTETNKLYDELMLDERHAQRENVYMSQGQKLTKIDPLAKPPVDPETMLPVPGPVNKTEVYRNPQDGRVITDEDGQPMTYEVTVNPYDDHAVHIFVHQNFQKSQEYELLSPEIQQILQDHVDEHKMEVIKERNALQADQALKGEEEETIPPAELPNPSPNGNQPEPVMA